MIDHNETIAKGDWHVYFIDRRFFTDENGMRGEESYSIRVQWEEQKPGHPYQLFAPDGTRGPHYLFRAWQDTPGGLAHAEVFLPGWPSIKKPMEGLIHSERSRASD